MEATKIYLAVDMRWLLMVGSIAGCKPCQVSMLSTPQRTGVIMSGQVSRNLFVATWVKYFYKWCIPSCFTYAPELVTGPSSALGSRHIWAYSVILPPGLPSPKMGYGILTPSVIATENKILGRPLKEWDQNCASEIPSPTGMIEDLAVVAERYQMAKWLGIPPDSIPHEKVSYTFPWNVWVPVEFADSDECASVKYAGRSVLYSASAGGKLSDGADAAGAFSCTFQTTTRSSIYRQTPGQPTSAISAPFLRAESRRI